MQLEEIQFILIVIAIIGGFWGKKYISDAAQTFIKNSIKAKAKITAIQLVRDGKYSHFKVSITFTDQLGAEIVSQTKGNKKYQEGDEVDILYLKTDPKKVKMADFAKTTNDLLKALTFMLLALVVILIIMVYKEMAQVPFL